MIPNKKMIPIVTLVNHDLFFTTSNHNRKRVSETICSGKDPSNELNRNLTDNRSKVNRCECIDKEQQPPKNTSSYLDIKVIQEILNRFLVEKKLPKEQLAAKLGITIDNLEMLLHNKSLHLIPKINLPLISLYCETKWE